MGTHPPRRGVAAQKYANQMAGKGGRLVEIEVLWNQIDDRTTYPFNIPAIASIKTLNIDWPVTFLVGENGSGKSTLLEAIAIGSGLNPEGGSRNFNFATRASHSRLDEALRLAKTYRLPGDSYFLRAESFFNVASEIERLDQAPGGPPIIGA